MSDIERAVDAGGEVVKEAVEHSRLGRNQFLVAVLAPTLALLSVTAGIIATGRSEEQARNREAEVERSRLVLPVYTDVVRKTEQLDAALDTCDDAFFLEDQKAFDEALEQCGMQLGEAFDDLDEAINVALLVSNEELRLEAVRFRESQEKFEATAEAYNGLGVGDGGGDGTNEAIERDYKNAQKDLERAKLALIDSARSQILIGVKE